MERGGLVAAIAAALMALPVPAAHATVAAAGPGGFAAGFLTPVVVAPQGETVTFYNGDLAPHNFVAFEDFLPERAARRTKWCSSYPKGRCPLFWTPQIGLGESTEVLGLQRAKAGKQYTFFCSLHPGMKGTLVVS